MYSATSRGALAANSAQAQPGGPPLSHRRAMASIACQCNGEFCRLRGDDDESDERGGRVNAVASDGAPPESKRYNGDSSAAPAPTYNQYKPGWSARDWKSYGAGGHHGVSRSYRSGVSKILPQFDRERSSVEGGLGKLCVRKQAAPAPPGRGRPLRHQPLDHYRPAARFELVSERGCCQLALWGGHSACRCQPVPMPAPGTS